MDSNFQWRKWHLALLGLLGFLLLASAARLLWTASRPPLAPPLPLTIAMPMQVAAGALYLAQDRQLDHAHGLTVTLQPFLLGKQALQAVLDEKADLALVADTPFALAVLRGEPVATLATVFESRKTMAVYARRDRGIESAASLGGKTVGTVAGTNAAYFLDTLLDVHGTSRDAVTIVSLKPEQLVSALVAGQVDAVTAWNPDLARLEQHFGQRGVTIYGEDFFVYRFLLVGRKSFIDRHPAQVARILSVLVTSNRMIKADPARTRSLLSKHLGMAPALLTRSFDPGDFTLTLDQRLLLALGDQSRWALGKQIVAPQPFPDFLDFVRTGPLTTLAPNANKIIR